MYTSRIILPLAVAAFFWFVPYAFGLGSLGDYWRCTYLIENGSEARLSLVATILAATYLTSLFMFHERIVRGVRSFECGERGGGAVAAVVCAWPLTLMPSMGIAFGAFHIGFPVVGAVVAVGAVTSSFIGIAAHQKPRGSQPTA